MRRAIFVLVISALCFSPAALASLTPRQAAQGFIESYNCTGKWANSGYCVPTTHKITEMTCKTSPSARGYFDCSVRLVRRHVSAKPLCGVIVIDTGFDVVANDHLLPCSEAFPNITT